MAYLHKYVSGDVTAYAILPERKFEKILISTPKGWLGATPLTGMLDTAVGRLQNAKFSKEKKEDKIPVIKQARYTCLSNGIRYIASSIKE